ncbi:hypothetical protein [uncultured Hymenobacter sp.]|uniref:hypothetical protein n=1 Tax=uncultured Hymenobacter sp. TaxID=170016 RepID=UPI0035CC5B4C
MLYLAIRVMEAAPLLPFVAMWIRRNTIPHKFNLVLYYVQAEVLFYILTTISRPVFRNDTYVTHISTALTVWFLAQMYRRLLSSVRIKKSIAVGIGIFLTIALLDAAFLSEGFTYVNSFSQAFGSAFLVTLALLHIGQISRTSLYLENQAEFFLSITTLIYFSYTIVTYVAINVIYNSDYDTPTLVLLDRIITCPDALLYAVHMGLLAWMFSFFPLAINPRRALPHWLHYSCWHPRPYKLLGQPAFTTYRLTTAAGN